MLWEKFDGIPYPFRLCFGDIYAPAAVVVGCWTDVETKGPVWCPCASFGAFLMDDDPNARRGNRSLIVVKLAVELGFRREAWVDAGVAKEVQCELGLLDEATP